MQDTAATSQPSDDAQEYEEQLLPPDPTSSTASTSSRQEPQLYPQGNNDGASSSCTACQEKRRYDISYTIEDIDLEQSDQRSTSSLWMWQQAEHSKSSEQSSSKDEAGPSSRGRSDLRKIRSTESRWAKTSFLSPDDALWDLKKNTDEYTEFRWELHSSKTDIDLAKKAKCGCHTPLTPEEKRHPERGDLRKHHSAEGDKWSLRPDSAHDLRKHLSDNSRIAGEPKATLQVPEVLPNPKPKCTCPKSKIPVSSDNSDVDDQQKSDTEEKHLKISPHSSDTSKKITVVAESKSIIKQASHQKTTKTKVSIKEKVVSPEESKKTLRSKWAMKSHFSMPQVERKDSTWSKVHDNPKSKSLKERPKYSIRRSISPEPDPRQVLRLDNRVIRRLISPEISLENAKWAPYEGYSPLPNVGIRKRETKKISEIKWEPYDGSPDKKDEMPTVIEPIEDDIPKEWPTVTPTHHPPEVATSVSREDEERWKYLNMISPFPLYQGGWKEESPPKTPPKDLSTPVWVVPQNIQKTPIRIAEPSPSPPKKRSIIKSRTNRKKGFRNKSESVRTFDEGLVVPKILSRASSEEPKDRQRPQLLRSKALLQVPKMDPTKRSLSEDVQRFRGSHKTLKGPHRARSEEAPRYDPWLENDRDEVREYVTTV